MAVSDLTHTAIAFVGVGSNIEPERNILAALETLVTMTTVTRCSTFYRTAALGRPDQPDFINGVWQIETAMTPVQVKQGVLEAIEGRLGRVRTGDKFESRTIDLDLLLYNDMVTHSDMLVLPHGDLERPFMYVPARELLAQMSGGSRGSLAAKMKDLLPSPKPRGQAGRPLEAFTGRLRQLLQS